MTALARQIDNSSSGGKLLLLDILSVGAFLLVDASMSHDIFLWKTQHYTNCLSLPTVGRFRQG